MRITIVGTGYVGLVTGTCFAETGNTVVCVDIDAAKVDRLKKGETPIFERGLPQLLQKNIAQGRLHFTTSLEEGIKGAQVIMLALPTPPGEGGAADLKYVLQVASQLGPMLSSYTVVVNKSTVPVGTADQVHQVIARTAQAEFDVVSNPEFLREGLAVEDFMKPERVIIGTSSEKARKVMEHLYAPFVRQGNPVIFMDIRSAELTKYAANAFLATKISFMNEIARVCEQVGANVDSVRKGIGTDSRIGKRFLFPGIGFGGSCFPKDVQALIHSAADVGYQFEILEAVESVNHRQKLFLFEKIESYFGGQLKGKQIALWGLAFKPHTDDIREAPALYNIDALINAGATVSVHDPEAMPNVKKLIGDKVRYFDSPYDALTGADALLICTEWPEYRTPDFDRIKSALAKPLIFDGRNIYEPAEMRELGFNYISIGRELVILN